MFGALTISLISIPIFNVLTDFTSFLKKIEEKDKYNGKHNSRSKRNINFNIGPVYINITGNPGQTWHHIKQYPQD